MLKGEIQNPVLRSFLSDSENYKLYMDFRIEPTISNRERLEKRFKQFYAKIRILSYFSKPIRFTAQNFDKKRRIMNNKQLLILDDPLQSHSNKKMRIMNKATMANQIENNVAKLNAGIEDYVQDETLYKAICQLTEKQKKVLYLSFIKELSDTEISKRFNVTQQAISKTRRNALQKVRRVISA